MSVEHRVFLVWYPDCTTSLLLKSTNAINMMMSIIHSLVVTAIALQSDQAGPLPSHTLEQHGVIHTAQPVMSKSTKQML